MIIRANFKGTIMGDERKIVPTTGADLKTEPDEMSVMERAAKVAGLLAGLTLQNGESREEAQRTYEKVMLEAAIENGNPVECMLTIICCGNTTQVINILRNVYRKDIKDKT